MPTFGAQSYKLHLAVLLLVTAPLILAAPADQSHADEYAAQLLDEENPQRHVAGLRLGRRRTAAYSGWQTARHRQLATSY